MTPPCSVVRHRVCPLSCTVPRREAPRVPSVLHRASPCGQRAAVTEWQVKQVRLEGQKGKVSEDDCQCLPACTSLEYEALTSQADLDLENYLKAHGSIMARDEGVVLTSLSIYFKDAQFITSRRSELYGKTDFLANCGGLLSLFSGFSLISLIEILYYLGIRLWCNVHRAHQKRAKGLGNLAIGGPFDVEKQPPQPSPPEEPVKF